MDKQYAVNIIYDIINSGIIKEEIEEDFRDIAKAIETDNWTREIKKLGNGRGC